MPCSASQRVQSRKFKKWLLLSNPWLYLPCMKRERGEKKRRKGTQIKTSYLNCLGPDPYIS